MKYLNRHRATVAAGGILTNTLSSVTEYFIQLYINSTQNVHSEKKMLNIKVTIILNTETFSGQIAVLKTFFIQVILFNLSFY